MPKVLAEGSTGMLAGRSGIEAGEKREAESSKPIFKNAWKLGRMSQEGGATATVARTGLDAGQDIKQAIHARRHSSTGGAVL